MVCIAAFIILALIGIFVALISIFRPKVGKSYLKMLKKAWECLWKKVRLQKCETGFKDDVKNTLLSRVIVKHPKWVKPLSIIIEIVSVVIVIVAIWALVTAVKSLLALWALGSCNVTKPSACSLGGEICSIDESEPKNPIEGIGRWFTEWGEIFEAIPEKFRSYNMAEYDINYITVDSDASGNNAERPLAVDIFDPGCSVCMVSYRNQQQSGFFDQYETRLVPFPIQDAEGNYKFKNSELVTRYIFAANEFQAGLGVMLIDHLFNDKNDDGLYYQSVFNDLYSSEQAAEQIEKWLAAAGVSEEDIAVIRDNTTSQAITDQLASNRHIIENDLKIKSIPTIFYDGAKHTGLYK